MALSVALPRSWRAWNDISPLWRTVLWLVLFVLLSRLLYLPSSQALEVSQHGMFEAPRNTSLVLEGVAAAEDAPAVTLAFDRFESFTLDSPRAELADASRALLASMGARLPQDSAAHALSWNVNLPPDEGGQSAPGFVRLEIRPAANGDLSLGTLDGNLVLGSHAPLDLQPVAQDYEEIGGWLRFDDRATGAPSDIMPELRLLPGGPDGTAQARIAWRAADPAMLLGDQFAADQSLAIRSIALVDAEGRLLTRYCGAPAGGLLLSAMFQPRLEPQVPASACRPGYLHASAIRFADGTIGLGLRGTAYVPGASQLLEKLKGNIVLWPVLAALIAIPGQKLLKGLGALFTRKEQKDGAPA